MRLLVVSNRLPFTASSQEGELVFRPSPGGLVSGLTAYLNWARKDVSSIDHLWIGWPGIEVDEKSHDKLRQKAAKEQAYPVFIDANTMDQFYHGFCNSTIWPLFHYFPTHARFDEQDWAQYVKVNEVFRDSILKVVKPGDTVWVHDYHLMLLPRLLREKIPELSIGFFLHTPFPSYDIFRTLPTRMRRQILEGILGADLVGFHTIDYTQHFLRCILRILGIDNNFGQLLIDGERAVRVDTFPMSVDYRQIRDMVKSEGVQREAEGLRATLGNIKTVLSLDRLDYTKGIKHRLEAYSAFLAKHPEWQRRVVLLLSVVPSRIGSEHYQQMKEEIDKLVGGINGKFGTIGWTPIVYRYRFLPHDQLLRLFAVSDVALVTPLRDGMNLIAKEYVASRSDRRGVLILSEMAGAARELGEALIINPNDQSEIVDALKAALEMPEDEQMRRNEVMQTRLERYDVIRWGQDFVDELRSVKEQQDRYSARLMDKSTRERLIKDYVGCEKRILLLDYDGTLSPFKERPETAVPGAILVAILNTLSEDPRNNLVIISGRHKALLEKWFGSLNIGIVAEHGAWIREKGKEWVPAVKVESDWKEKVLPILKSHEDRLPGSFTEEKEFSLVWNFRAADPELASVRSKELADELSYFSENTEVQVLQASKSIEVRNIGIDKGTAAKLLLSQENFDFVLAVGDDQADEDLFKVLPEKSFSIKVGLAKSYAKYDLRNHRDVVQLLTDLTKTMKSLESTS
ncbi:bifunctional alpha,alpha-trehalose-phosphate synthase (UDP-forming)/trehalose-phosphatase [Candidatus Bathyarchaeota archaeon]|nr:MAG: bifunctional alpha,alpha-trehalose-phosphate synthase (UDP-forming)/trehalose-phosphatase [Candidatus Bathyarchaeota archaeon]